MRRFAEAATLIVVLLAVFSLAASRSNMQGSRESFASSYDNGAYGLLGLYDVLRARGVAVERFEHPFGLLPKGGTLLIATTKYEVDSPTVVAQSVDKADERAVRAFAQGGGHVVILGSDKGFQFTEATGLKDEIVERSGSGATTVLDVAQTSGVARLDGPYTYLKPYRTLTTAYPLLGTRDGAFAYTVPIGKGDITVVVSESPFDNAHLGSGDNMQFAYDLVHRGGTVYFDEYVHGYDAGKTFWAALPEPVHVAVYLCAVLIAIVLIDANIRLAPAIALDPPDERDSSAYVASMARLLRRARAGRAAVRRFAEDAARMRRSRERPDTEQQFNELQRLAALDRPAPGDVRRAALLHALLRKDAS